ncbi:Rv1733c family protein [Actinacidiphila sp. bgisy167]|uniref:Rv1733c family protein n=1 Tax=Actinacidiphila sp. bgisy167 TaxID=3413797 RepID=UPI003D72359F
MAATHVRWWRWRKNSLRRRSDVFEGFASVVAGCAIVLGAPAAGLTAGLAVDRSLQHTVRVEQANRTQVGAVVIQAGPREAADPDPESGRVREAHRDAVVRWTAPDGHVHTAQVRVDAARDKGDRVTMWTDKSGVVPMPAPLDAHSAATHAMLAGIGTFFATCVLGVMGRQLLMWQLMRRRLAEWEREWAAAGQSWGRAGAGG